MTELYGSLFVTLIGDIPSLPARGRSCEPLSLGHWGDAVPAPRASLLPLGSPWAPQGTPGRCHAGITALSRDGNHGETPLAAASGKS